jgi:hypothetical protein
MSEHVVARLTIERFIAEDGADLVRVDSDDLNGDRVAVVEALGLLQLAMWDVCNSPADPEDSDA